MERVDKRVRGSVVGAASKSQVPTMVIQAMAEVQEVERAKPARERLAGIQKKHVVVNAVSAVVDEMDTEHADDIKELLPELVDVFKAIINGKVPGLEAFVTPENLSAIARLGKNIKKLFCCGCCKRQHEPKATPVAPIVPKVKPETTPKDVPIDTPQSESEVEPAMVSEIEPAMTTPETIPETSPETIPETFAESSTD